MNLYNMAAPNVYMFGTIDDFIYSYQYDPDNRWHIQKSYNIGDMFIVPNNKGKYDQYIITGIEETSDSKIYKYQLVELFKEEESEEYNSDVLKDMKDIFLSYDESGDNMYLTGTCTNCDSTAKVIVNNTTKIGIRKCNCYGNLFFKLNR